MMKITTILILCFLLIASSISAQDEDESTLMTIRGKHQAGVRLGGWINKGDTPPELIISQDSTDRIETSINKGSFYLEGYFAYNVLPSAFVEFSVGLVNRGSVSVFEDGNTDIGNLIVYPILVSFKVYPIGHTQSRFQPFVSAGGGLYYGRRDVQIIRGNYYDYTYDFRGDTETDFNIALSGGFDWLMNDMLAVEFNMKYMPISFGEPLVGVNKYNGISMTVGIKYLKNK